MIATRKEIARAFRNAKSHLKTGAVGPGSYFVCIAIIMHPGTPRRISDAAQKVVSDRIAPHPSVAAWLRLQPEVCHGNMDTKNLQEYRHRWLDSLIEEFSK